MNYFWASLAASSFIFWIPLIILGSALTSFRSFVSWSLACSKSASFCFVLLEFVRNSSDRSSRSFVTFLKFLSVSRMKLSSLKSTSSIRLNSESVFLIIKSVLSIISTCAFLMCFPLPINLKLYCLKLSANWSSTLSTSFWSIVFI